jgi:hypothetical protein
VSTFEDTTPAERSPRAHDGAPQLPVYTYTPEQAAPRLGVDQHGRPIKSANWLKDQVRRERIPCTRLGKTITFSERDLAEIVEVLRSPARNKRR